MTQGTAGPDADFVLTETQNWASRSHRELYDAVHTENEPGRVGQLADEWNKLSREFGDAAQLMAERLRATETGWQGRAADSARAAIHQLAEWNSDAGTTAGALAERISTQGRVMEAAKAEMPEPLEGAQQSLNLVAAVTFASGNLQAFAKACSDMKVVQERATAAHQQAVEVMTRMEDRSRTIDGDTPRFTPPPNPVQTRTSPMLRGTPRTTPGIPLSPRHEGTTPAAAPESGGSVSEPQRLDPRVNADHAPSAGQPAAVSPSGWSGGDQTGPGGTGSPDAPPRTFAAPDPTVADSPSVRTRHGGPQPADCPPSNTSPQSTTPSSVPNIQPSHIGDDRMQPLRPYQVPDGVPVGGPGGSPPSQPFIVGTRTSWRGQVPQIPPTGGPGGDSPSRPGIGGGSGPGAGGGPGASRPGIGGGPGASRPGIGGGSGVSGSGFGGGSGSGGAGSRGGPAGLGGSAGPGGSSGVGPGGASGTGRGGEGAFGGRGSAGGPGQAGMAGGGGMSQGGAQRGRSGEEDKERTSKYVEGGPIVEVPGAELPPPVIGEGKRKKQDQG